MKSMAGGAPELMPVLSRGKHRTPRSGGCFMEFASYLAGEAWSDHPWCTHPALASLARMVNDCTSDDSRSELVSLIPSVIGLRGGDERIAMVVALRAGTAALAVASEQRQRALAVGILTCERHLAGLGDRPMELSALSRAAFDQAPGTERWAQEFIGSFGPRSRSRFTPGTADSIMRVAVQGLAEACIPDADARLRDLLVAAIDDVSGLLGVAEVSPESSVTTAPTTAPARAARVPARP